MLLTENITSSSIVFFSYVYFVFFRGLAVSREMLDCTLCQFWRKKHHFVFRFKTFRFLVNHLCTSTCINQRAHFHFSFLSKPYPMSFSNSIWQFLLPGIYTIYYMSISSLQTSLILLIFDNPPDFCRCGLI